ncbi:MerR family transcriptional regulator [Nocardia terpenica]|uniref:MerR family transcriptional regulator n=1 Tax=Nocardia terpenica TaxID=455432 RepID=A0A6G9Z3H3_9NOCA|nr:MerR family transcriptional regulator [Nocardia terpenica]QIS20032.1 MerR family transcriptional regulator [Nocardia terpenica]
MTTDPRPPDPADADGDLTVGRAAALVGISVRTLHHWDVIGLVRPSGRTWAGYRIYSGEDIARIHRVLVYRELGFPLSEIARLLDDPAVDAREHLRRQRSELGERISRLRDMVAAVDRMLAASANGMRLTPEQQVEIFGDQWRPDRVEEAERRWGDTPQWAQYAERAATMSPEEWKQVAADIDTLHADLAAAKRSSVAPGSAAADALAERHRACIARHFDCTHAMQVCLARMFVTDPGYTAYYDGLAPGLTEWLRDIVFANAAAHGVDPETAVWE